MVMCLFVYEFYVFLLLRIEPVTYQLLCFRYANIYEICFFFQNNIYLFSGANARFDLFNADYA